MDKASIEEKFYNAAGMAGLGGALLGSGSILGLSGIAASPDYPFRAALFTLTPLFIAAGIGAAAVAKKEFREGRDLLKGGGKENVKAPAQNLS